MLEADGNGTSPVSTGPPTSNNSCGSRSTRPPRHGPRHQFPQWTPRRAALTVVVLIRMRSTVRLYRPPNPRLAVALTACMLVGAGAYLSAVLLSSGSADVSGSLLFVWICTAAMAVVLPPSRVVVRPTTLAWTVDNDLRTKTPEPLTVRSRRPKILVVAEETVQTAKGRSHTKDCWPGRGVQQRDLDETALTSPATLLERPAAPRMITIWVP
jgi:hypothetical protein